MVVIAAIYEWHIHAPDACKWLPGFPCSVADASIGELT
jgi:hypothetical protein